MMETYFKDYAKKLNLTMPELLALGRENPQNSDEPFCMTVLALKLSYATNAVSKLHGQISRNMWQNLWQKIDVDEVPIGYITNGVHLQSWLSDEMARLYELYLGNRWIYDPVNYAIWSRVDKIPDSELWRSHERMRERLISFARSSLKNQLKQRGAHFAKIAEAKEVLDPEALTIGFARRFATYKRATLLFKDEERLARILNNDKYPLQFIFAGKAHPKDQPGKELIREIIHLARSEKFRRKIVFIEDYKIDVARYLVQGVDVWLNNPRRPLEASGTSGMKVPINGGINLSVLDGWWCEAYDGENGWAIGNGEEYDDLSYQDEVESKALYDLLEFEIIPLFYDRGRDGLPRKWIERMNASIKTICPQFNTNRMVEEYTEKFYLPSILRWNWLASDNLKETKSLITWKKCINRHWKDIRIRDVRIERNGEIKIGDRIPVNISLFLGEIKPDDVTVELCCGVVQSDNKIKTDNFIVLNEFSNGSKFGNYTFSGNLLCNTCGKYGFKVRVSPYAKGISRSVESDYLTWW